MAFDVAPIALFVYNRPWHTRQTIEALQFNELAMQSELVVFSDGPKAKVDMVKVQEVRNYIKTITGFADVIIIEREQNLGLANSIISGVTEIVNRYGKIIVLEDDMVSSPYFLSYMNNALVLYENERKVVCIHGYTYPVNRKLPDTFFLKGADCWGWGTWKRGWDLFEADGTKLLNDLKDKKLTHRFNFNGTYDYSRMLKAQIAGKNDSWAVRWYASALLSDRLTLYPGQSLIQNIGTDQSGTHCCLTNDYRTVVATKPVQLERLKPEEDRYALTAFQDYYTSIRPSMYMRLFEKLKVGIGC